MKSLKFWTLAILTDIAAAVLFYAWKFENIEGAGNVVLLVTWTVIVIRIITALSKSKRKFEERPKGFPAYNAATDLLLACAFVWFGHFLTASFVIIGLAMSEGARMLEKEKSAAESDKLSNLLTISGGPASGKSTALDLISEQYAARNETVAFYNGGATETAVRYTIESGKANVIIIDENEPESGKKIDVRKLATEFPHTKFVAVQ